jgi:hypothetical protein
MRIAGDGVQDRIGPGQRVGRSGAGPVALEKADQREGERGEDGGDPLSGVHGLRPEVRRDEVVHLGQAGLVESDVQAGLGQDHGETADRGRVPHVAE